MRKIKYDIFWSFSTKVLPMNDNLKEEFLLLKIGVMLMIFYNTLEKINVDALYKTFLDAFSDYQVKIDLPFWKFRQMLQRRGYAPEISIGAFQEKDLIGFSLNGVRSWREKATVYDIATGVIPEYRRKGITSGIFLCVKALLQEKPVEQYLLEVIKSNRPAVQLYQEQGFKIQREFSCFQLKKENFIPREIYHVDEIEKIDFNQVTAFWDYAPSWQNTIDSIRAVQKSFAYFVVKANHTIIGYGIVDKNTGDIPQIAVAKDCRGNGIGSSILSKMVQSTKSETLGLLNVETGLKTMEFFLNRTGFVYEVSQFEMLLRL